MRCTLCLEIFTGQICSHCGSTADLRSLAWFLRKRVVLSTGMKVLDLGMDAKLWPWLGNDQFLRGARLTVLFSPGSIRPELKAPNRVMPMTPTSLSFSDQSLDLILADGVFHRLKSDFQAMSEVHRCLRPKGIALLGERIFAEKSEHTTEWAYGADYYERLQAAGFFVEKLRVDALASAEAIQVAGLNPEYEFTFACKFRETLESFLSLWT